MSQDIAVPETLFHGTPFHFDQFKFMKSGIHLGSLEQASHALSWKSGRVRLSVYAGLPTMEGGQRGYILECRIKVSRVERIDDQRTPQRWSRAIAKARTRGIQAFCYVNEYECPWQNQDSWVVFDSDSVEIIGRPFNH